MFSVATMLLGFGLFYQVDSKQVVGKEKFVQELAENAGFETLIENQRANIDSAYKHIVNYNTNVNAIFLEHDIQYALEDIKGNYQRQTADGRYKLFYHVYTLYNTLFFNRRELSGNSSDIERLKKNLEDCQRATRQLKESLTQQSLK